MYKRRRLTDWGARAADQVLGDDCLPYAGSDVRYTGAAQPIYVSHDEYIGDIASSSLPMKMQLEAAIQPLNPTIFPWLSQIAANFQQYRFLKLQFIYTTTSTDALTSANTSLGYLAMAADYNVNTAAPFNRRQMENIDGMILGKPSRSFVLNINCSPPTLVLPMLFIPQKLSADVRTPMNSNDPRFNCLCNFYLACGGNPKGTNSPDPAAPEQPFVMGELRVRYTCMFVKPILTPGDSDARMGGGVAVFGLAASSSQQAVVAYNTTPLTIDPATGHPLYHLTSNINQHIQPLAPPPSSGLHSAAFGEGITSTQPLGTYGTWVTGTDDFSQFTVDNMLPQFAAIPDLNSIPATGLSPTGFNSLVIPPRADGLPWQLCVKFEWTGMHTAFTLPTGAPSSTVPVNSSAAIVPIGALMVVNVGGGNAGPVNAASAAIQSFELQCDNCICSGPNYNYLNALPPTGSAGSPGLIQPWSVSDPEVVRQSLILNNSSANTVALSLPAPAAHAGFAAGALTVYVRQDPAVHDLTQPMSLVLPCSSYSYVPAGDNQFYLQLPLPPSSTDLGVLAANANDTLKFVSALISVIDGALLIGSAIDQGVILPSPSLV